MDRPCGMPPRKIIVGFLWRLVLWYGLLIAPWPGLNAAYGRFFRSAGNGVFSRETGRRLLRFEPVPASSGHLLDTRILLANREVVDQAGNTPAKYLEMDTRAMGWIPMALLMALMLSTPVPWRRRVRGLFLGLLLVNAFILFSLAVYIWNNSPDLGLLVLSPLAKQITAGLEETLVTQVGASFVIPVLIWMLTIFNLSDFAAWRFPPPSLAEGKTGLTRAGK